MWTESNDPDAFEGELAKLPPEAADAIRKFVRIAEAVKDTVRQSESSEDPRAKVRLLEAAKVALSELVACASGHRGIALDGLSSMKAKIRSLEKAYARRGFYLMSVETVGGMQ